MYHDNEGREEIRGAAKYRAYNIFETLGAAVTKKKKEKKKDKNI